MNKFGYRSIWYDSRKKVVHLWTWDDNGNRVEKIEPFNPYLFVETTHAADAVSVFGTNLRKMVFPSQFERRRYVKECGVKRLFFNLKAEQQFLIERYLGLNETFEFAEKPLKIYPLDIEVDTHIHRDNAPAKIRKKINSTEQEITIGILRCMDNRNDYEVWDSKKQEWTQYEKSYYSTEQEFPNPEAAKYPINLITIFDSISKKFHTFGTKPYTPTQPDVIYHYCTSESNLLEKLLTFWESDYPDVITGWNCISGNQYIWTNDKITLMSKLNENIPLFTSEKCSNVINIHMNTGKKTEYQLKTTMGHSILCSEEHIFPICTKTANQYKNPSSLLKTKTDTKLKNIDVTKDNYVFIQKHINANTHLTYKSYILDNWELIKKTDNFDFIIKSQKIRDSLKNKINQPNIKKEYWQGKTFWKRKGWNYRNLYRFVDDKEILEYIQKEDVMTFKLTKKHIHININDIIENDVIRMLGFTFTDGCVDYKTYTNQYSSKHQNLTEKYTNIYNKINNKNIKLSRQQKSDNNFYKRISCNNKLGILLPIIYEGNKKHLNITPLSQLSYEQFIAFYSGMIDGDGCVSSQLNVCNFDNKWENNLNTLQQILLWNGVIATVTENNIAIPFITYNKKFIDKLDIWHNTRTEKIENISYFDKKNTISKSIKWFEFETFILVKIAEICETGKKTEMFDMSTETHYFTCNGIKTHNCDGFDIPYIVNRITNVLGEDHAKRLSPVGSIYYKADIAQKFGKAVGRWVIHGLNSVDYKYIYQTFSREKREAYNLDYIGKVELGEGKIKINATNLAVLSVKDWPKFVEYNIQDVNILNLLEEKLRFLKTMRIISHKGFCNIEATMGKVAVVSGAIAAQALKRNQMLCTFEHEDMGEYSGGFVKEVEPGLKEGVITFDANSLYPNVIITLNLSPETKIGKVISTDKEKNEVEIRLVNGKIHTLTREDFISFLHKEKVAISKAKILYSQKTKGIVPEYVDALYKERVTNSTALDVIEKSLVHCKKGSEKYIENKKKMEHLDILQYTQKILLNSIYGVFANKYGPLYDIDCAASITNTGQAVIKEASTILDTYALDNYGIKESITHYNDTDSCHITLQPILELTKQPLLDGEGKIAPNIYVLANAINKHLNEKINEWSADILCSTDSRFYFKRETICSTCLYQAKKRYILHIKDKGKDEPMHCDKIKPVGVELVKITMSDTIKNMIKEVVVAILNTKNREKTLDVYRKIFEQFKTLPVEEVAFRSAIKTYDKYAPLAIGFAKAKRTPVAVAGAIYYNNLLKEYNLTSTYETLRAGDRVKWVYCTPNNHYNISNIAFTDKIPSEFVDIQTDYDKMFKTIVTPAIERLFECTHWKMVDLQAEYTVDLLDFFKE
jgi:DNA polymerase elongation subunit (family B)